MHKSKDLAGYKKLYAAKSKKINLVLAGYKKLYAAKKSNWLQAKVLKGKEKHLKDPMENSKRSMAKNILVNKQKSLQLLAGILFIPVIIILPIHRIQRNQ